MSTTLEKIKNLLLSKEESKETKLYAEMILDDGRVLATEDDEFIVGSIVMIVGDDGETAMLGAGTYTLQDGSKITIDDESKILTIGEEEEEVQAEEEKEEMKDKEKEEEMEEIDEEKAVAWNTFQGTSISIVLRGNKIAYEKDVRMVIESGLDYLKFKYEYLGKHRSDSYV